MLTTDFWHTIVTAMHGSPFYQLAGLMILAGGLGLTALLLRQPLIVAYIVVGLLAGPSFLNIVGPETHSLDTLSQLGIAILLFLVGLKLDLDLIKKLGPMALIAGIAQVVLTFVAGSSLALMLGLGILQAGLLGLAMAFSSTILVVKMLSDKREIESLYGKMALGILIVQDIVVILAMVAATALAGPSSIENLSPAIFGMVFAKLGVLLLITILFTRFISTPLTHRLSRSPELLSLFAVGMAATLAAICHALDLSKEMGGLLAGMALASTPYRAVISSRLAPLRDFLLLFFFINLGASLDVGVMQDQFLIPAVLTLFVLLGKPAIIVMIMGILGYRKRISFMAGTTLAQTSEFSLIFIALCASIGMADPQSVGIITMVTMVSLAVSTYGMTHAEKVYHRVEPWLDFLERRIIHEHGEQQDPLLSQHYDIILFGLGRYGMALHKAFTENGMSVLGIDFNPEAIKQAKKHDILATYGDAEDAEFPASLPYQGAKAIIMAMPHTAPGPLTNDIRYTTAQNFRALGFNGHIAVISHTEEETEALHSAGADTILHPFKEAARGAVADICETIRVPS